MAVFCLGLFCVWHRYQMYQGMPMLISMGCDPDATDKQVCTPLHVALQKNDDIAVRILCENGACVSLENQNGQTALQLAETKSPTILQLVKQAETLPTKSAGKLQ
eukprot:m.242653 g.242653  ORF g.242653 m.242653 type:complete len:105 (-) comp19010_c0_seq9:160-474(-)